MENKIFTKTETVSGVHEGLRQYMIKVYNFMAAGLCLTALSAYLVANTSLMHLFFSINQMGQITGLSALGWIAFIAPLIMVFAFGWVLTRGTSSQVQVMFWAYSAVMGISLTPIVLGYTGASLARVFLITAGMFGAMSIYGYTTKKDLTGMGSFLFMGLIGIIIASIVNIFLQSPGVYYAVSFLGIFIFVGLTAYDTQRIRNIYSEYDNSEIITKKAIMGALNLYLDFVNMFIYLLQFLGDRR